MFPTLYGFTLYIEMFVAIFGFQIWKRKCVKKKDVDDYPMEHAATIEKGSAAEKSRLYV